MLHNKKTNEEFSVHKKYNHIIEIKRAIKKVKNWRCQIHKRIIVLKYLSTKSYFIFSLSRSLQFYLLSLFSPQMNDFESIIYQNVDFVFSLISLTDIIWNKWLNEKVP